MIQQDIQHFKKEFDHYFDSWLDHRIHFLKSKSPAMHQVVADAKPLFVTQGKRIRAFLTYCAFHEAGGTSQDAGYQLGVAIELVHAFALVHDDIMDESASRRGYPTMHVSQESFHKEQKLRGDSSHYGLSSAILVGDLLLTYANEAIATLPLEHADVVATNRIFAQMQQELAAGQYEDIWATATLSERTEADVMRIMSAKTGTYTVGYPIKIGATAGGWNPKQADQFDEFSELLGQAFQIHDDILGGFGDEKVTGKSVSSDITQGKPTLLLVYTLRHAKVQESVKLLSLIGKRSLSDKDVEYIRSVMVKSGAHAYAEQKEKQLVERALEALGRIKISEKMRMQLQQLAQFLMHRVS